MATASRDAESEATAFNVKQDSPYAAEITQQSIVSHFVGIGD